MKTLQIAVLLVLVSSINNVFAQSKAINNAKVKEAIGNKTKGTLCYAKVVNGDTIPVVYMQRAVWCVDKRRFKNPIAEWRYNRLVKNVKAAYPYAKIAGRKMKEYNTLLVNVKTEDEKHRAMKKIENELRDEFEEDLKDLTITQGRILLKLIDRETGNSSYALIRDLRGSTTASFGQALALLFGNDLKAEYEADGGDKQVEQIVQLLERGAI